MNPSRPAARAFAWAGAALFGVSLAVFAYAYLVEFGQPAPAGPSWPPVMADVALFSVFALHHSFLARHRPRAWVQRMVPLGLERAVYVWSASVLFLMVCLSWQPVPGVLYRLTGPGAIAGYIIQAVGVVLTLRSSAALGLDDLAGVRPVSHPLHPGTAPLLSTSGIYGFVRHPLYFAWLLMVFGAPHMTMTRFVFAVVSTAYVAMAIPFEERGLIRTFGDDYRAYRRKVRWRMVPGVY